jgi:hypothetical protein
MDWRWTLVDNALESEGSREISQLVREKLSEDNSLHILIQIVPTIGSFAYSHTFLRSSVS